MVKRTSSLPSGWSYRCSQNPKNIDGTGWIPIPFGLNSLLNVRSLPVDPINKPPYYYAFIAGGGYKITAKLDIMKEFSINDGGNDPLVYEAGNNLKLPSIQYGLILFFPFNEGTGTIAYDRSGFEDNGTLINFNFNTSSGWTIDEGRNGVILDGIDDYVLTTKLLIDIPTSEIFIGMWINFKEKKDGDFILYTGATTGSGIDMYFKGPTSENPKIMTRFKAPTSDLKALSSNSPDLNQWYFIAVNFKKPHVNVYFYPNLEASGLFNTSTIFSEPLKIGSSTSKFIIDGIRIYSKALTTDEIKILYENYTRSF